MTAPGPITRGRPRRMNSEARAAATLNPTMPTAPIVTAAPVCRRIVMIKVIIGSLVKNLGFGESLLQCTNVPLPQGSVACVLHQARVTSLETLTLEF